MPPVDGGRVRRGGGESYGGDDDDEGDQEKLWARTAQAEENVENGDGLGPEGRFGEELQVEQTGEDELQRRRPQSACTQRTV
jgi:hypothetical protein